MQRHVIVCSPKALPCSPRPKENIKDRKKNKTQKDYAAAKSWCHRINDPISHLDFWWQSGRNVKHITHVALGLGANKVRTFYNW